MVVIGQIAVASPSAGVKVKANKAPEWQWETFAAAPFAGFSQMLPHFYTCYLISICKNTKGSAAVSATRMFLLKRYEHNIKKIDIRRLQTRSTTREQMKQNAKSA